MVSFARPDRWWWGVVALALTALLGLAAFPRGTVPEAAYVCLFPLLLWLYWSRPSGRLVLLGTLLAGWVQWVGLLWWLRHFPDQVGLSPALGWMAVGALAFVLAWFLVAWALFARWVLPYGDGHGVIVRLLVMLGLAGLWVVLEWIRSWLLSGFPWLPLAASQWQRPLLLQLAAWTGAWGVSAVLVLFNLGLFHYVRHFVRSRRQVWYKRFSLEFYLGLGGIFAAVSIGLVDLPQSAPQRVFRGGFIQPYILPPERWNYSNMETVLGEFELVCKYAIFNDAEVILWPEASTPLPAPGDPRTEAWLGDLARRLEVPILMGNLALRHDPETGRDRYYNAIVTVTPEAGVSPDFAAKRHLVPFGEYVPGWLPFLDKVVPLEGQFTPGTEPTVLRLPVGGRSWRVGPLVCYEDVFPSLARDLVRQGVDLLFVATNDAWYGEESAAYQHAAHSVLRAVETRRPVLRSGNAGWSGWIDERGHIRHVLRGADHNVYFQGAEAVEVYRQPEYAGRLSFYMVYGDWFVAVSAAFFVAVALLRWRWPEPRLLPGSASFEGAAPRRWR